MEPQAFIPSSEAFADGELIPAKYSCEGLDISPPIYWGLAPAGTRTIAILLEDPNAPGGSLTHWLVYNLPPDLTALQEGAQDRHDLPPGAQPGRNSSGKTGYNGPCPPRGDDPHHYVFHVFALDAPLDLRARAQRDVFERSIQGHVLAEGLLMGVYARR